MEVHHHGHVHHDSVWKQYLSQFIMLFLAVLCGSLAEYYLDHNIEDEKEVQYANSMIQDLDEDLINLDKAIKFTSEKMQMADSLTADLLSDDYQKKTAMIYYRARKLSVLSYNYKMTDGTLMELKNSGNLRLIKSKAMVDSIQSYYNVYQRSDEAQRFAIEELTYYRELMIQVFDVKVFDKMIKNFPKITVPEGNPSFFNNDKALINQFLMRVEFCKTTSKTELNFLYKLKNSALRLKESIGKAYLEE